MMRISRALVGLALAAILSLSTATEAFAFSTIDQNSDDLADKANTTAVARVVAYGDSIYAGYYQGFLGWPSKTKRAAPFVAGEYAKMPWNRDVRVIRRTRSGAKADDIYHNKIIAERSYMQDASTLAVMFEMCGNDYLQARSSYKSNCSQATLDGALAACTDYTNRAMQAIKTYAPHAKVRVVSNLYYPGYNADAKTTACGVNLRDKFLPILARSNHMTCRLADQHGFKCMDTFAGWMAADYDANNDGKVDAEAIRYVPGESEDAYVARILSLKATLRDANTKLTSSSTTYDYLQSDDTHPTYTTSSYTESDLSDGYNVDWNKRGHERMGWIGWQFLREVLP
jgi:lysophospholipase L1-like esterase